MKPLPLVCATIFSLLPAIFGLSINLPLANTLHFANTNMLVTWSGQGAGLTSIQISLAKSDEENALGQGTVLAQGVNAASGSTTVQIPKDTTNGNYYLVLTGNDTPATVVKKGPLHVVFGSSSSSSSSALASSSSSAAVTAASSSASSSSAPASSTRISSSPVASSTSKLFRMMPLLHTPQLTLEDKARATVVVAVPMETRITTVSAVAKSLVSPLDASALSPWRAVCSSLQSAASAVRSLHAMSTLATLATAIRAVTSSMAIRLARP
ncbi:hypothetical protein BCR43DRAFT_336766 [Syncephalastrum racemosum]|uniref:Yeast cell wall synthesis Kre9/Knh1-like N-terminal domain-containing protein n=1 Tax=Syncephalastrum racemosum TaxID=13706 RepID=A0A1X2H8Q6_SYNRA|nr:hypothetical protein BCR43DRAFT_336766 [Syncephalastrum racemosum]